MKFLKSLLATFAIASFLVMPHFASAQNLIANGLETARQGTGLANPCSGQPSVSTCISVIIGNIIGIVLGFVEVILFLLFIYAGFLWMTAGGDTKQVDTAKSMLKNAVAGLIIIGLSYLLTSFIITQFSQSIGNASGAGAGATTTTP